MNVKELYWISPRNNAFSVDSGDYGKIPQIYDIKMLPAFDSSPPVLSVRLPHDH
jgi:hypothetical protein